MMFNIDIDDEIFQTHTHQIQINIPIGIVLYYSLHVYRLNNRNNMSGKQHENR